MDADELVRAIRAALDETERLANEANVKQDDPDWFVSPVTVTGGQHFTVRSKRDMRPIARVERLDGDADEPAGILDGRAAAEHIAHNDPAAVLRRVAADRELVNMAENAFLSAGVFRDIDERWGAVEMQYLHVMRTLARGLGITPEEETP